MQASTSYLGSLPGSVIGTRQTQNWTEKPSKVIWTYPTYLPWRGNNLFCISPDECFFAVVGQDGTVRVFELNP